MSPARRPGALAGNLATLYGAHVLGLIVPILTVPYLARVLRPEGWGVVVFAQSFAAWLILLLEYGFDLSGTREVARARHEPEVLPRVVAGIQGAKVLLFGLLTLATALLFMGVPLFRTHPLLLGWAWVFAVLRGLSPFWYFLGIERIRAAAVVDASAKVVAALGVFLWVRGPEDGWRVLALQALASGASLVVMTGWLYRSVRMEWPGRRLVTSTLRRSAGIFVFRASSGLYIQANAFLLGLLTTPQVVAFFGGAEKIVRAAINLLHPMSQTLFPRLSHLVVADPAAAKRLFRLSTLGMVGLGVAMGVAAFVGAEPLVGLFLGPGYEAAVPVLRVLAFLPPVVSVGGVLGIQWALPMGLDRPFYRLVLAGGALNVVLAFALTPRLGAVGMAVSVLCADLLVSAGLLTLFRRQGFSRTTTS